MRPKKLISALRAQKFNTHLRPKLTALYILALGLTCSPRLPYEEQTYITALSIKPDNDVLLVDNGAQGTKPFSVLAYYSDGHTEDYSTRARWSTDNQWAGNFEAQIFRSSSFSAPNVMFTEVHATANDRGRLVTATARLTVVWLHKSGPKPDIFFWLPYQSKDSQNVTFTTFIQQLDSFLAIDTTDQTGNDYEVSQIAQNLQSAVIDKIKGPQPLVPRDAKFGVGAFDDFPLTPHGKSCPTRTQPLFSVPDQPFTLLQAITSESTALRIAASRLSIDGRPRGCGSTVDDHTVVDTPQSQLEALYQIATGSGQSAGGASIPDHKVPGTIGGVEFRPGSQPLIVVTSDSAFHTKEAETPSRLCNGDSLQYSHPLVQAATRTWPQTLEALNQIFGRVVGFSTIHSVSEDCLATKDLVRLANETGAVVDPLAWGDDAKKRPAGCSTDQCCTGLMGKGEPPNVGGAQRGLCPLVYKVSDDVMGQARELPASILDGIRKLVQFASFEVIVDAVGDEIPGQPGKSTSDFVKGLTPKQGTPSQGPVVMSPVARPDQGGFSSVVPSSTVTFQIDVTNDLVAQADTPQVHYARLNAHAGNLARKAPCFNKQVGCADLDSRLLIIVVPPVTPQ